MSHTGHISWAQSRGNKLGYYRASVSCDYCRKRKRRCQPSASGKGCGNCVRLGRQCVAVKVEVMEALDALGEAATPDGIARVQRLIGHVKSDMPAIKSSVPHPPSQPSTFRSQSRWQITARPAASFVSPLTECQPPETIKLNEQSDDATQGHSITSADDTTWPLTGHLPHSQLEPRDDWSAQATSVTVDHTSQGFLYHQSELTLQTDFDFLLTTDQPFATPHGWEAMASTIHVPVTESVWDLNLDNVPFNQASL